MAERMTRDEHVVRAQALASGADDLVATMTVKGDKTLAPVVSALAALSATHARIAVALSQPPVAPVTPVRPWIPNHRGYWQYGPWALIVSGPSGVPSSSGWYLFGPGLGDNGAPMGTPDFAEAQRAADVHIDAWLSEPTS